MVQMKMESIAIYLNVLYTCVNFSHFEYRKQETAKDRKTLALDGLKLN